MRPSPWILRTAQIAGVTVALLLTAAPALARGPEYFRVRPDVRRCAPPLCGGYFIEPVNRRAMRCSDGKRRTACYVHTIEWSAVGPSVGLSSSLHGQLPIVRGWLEETDFDRTSLTLGVLIATELWDPIAGKERARHVVRLSDSGRRCKYGPCPSLVVEPLNRRKVRKVHQADLGRVGLDAAQLAAAQAQLRTPS